MILHFKVYELLDFKCRWPDSNRHGVNRLILSQVRLPIPPQRLIQGGPINFAFSTFFHFFISFFPMSKQSNVAK